MTDLPFTQPPDRPALGATPRCRRHVWLPELRQTGGGGGNPWSATYEQVGEWCCRCGAVKDPAASRRGANNRKRGNAEELTVARTVGGRKVGQLGQPWDVEIDGYMRAQVKKLATWPSITKVLEMIDAIPPARDLRAAILTQPGRRPRRLIVLDLDEFARWHGDPTQGERL